MMNNITNRASYDIDMLFMFTFFIYTILALKAFVDKSNNEITALNRCNDFGLFIFLNNHFKCMLDVWNFSKFGGQTHFYDN